MRWAARQTDSLWRVCYNRVLRRAHRDRLSARPPARPGPFAASGDAVDVWGHRAMLAAFAAYEVDAGEPDEGRRIESVRGWLEREAGCRHFSPLRSVVRGPAPTLVLEGGGAVQVASRGTFSALDVWEDFRARLVPAGAADGLPECRVHEGFFRAFLAQAGDVEPSVPLDGLVLFHGHSLGAVCAQQLAMRYALRRRAEGGQPGYRAPVLTFGCPRGGDAAYQRAVGELTEHVRVYNEADPMASLPGPDMPLARRRFWGGEYAPHAAEAHVEIRRRGPAVSRPGAEGASLPVPPRTLLVALARFARYHPQDAYAASMLSHIDGLSMS